MVAYVFALIHWQSLLQHTDDKDGSALGVVVTRDAMFMHTVALTQACGYTEGLLDFSKSPIFF